MKLTLKALAAIAMLLPAAACTQAGGEKPGVGNKLINVPLTTLDGKKTTLAKLVKGRVTAFKFSATWCAPCTLQLREFDKVIDTYGDKVVVLDIDIRESARKVKAYHAKNKFRTPTVLDPTGAAARRYNVEGIPTVIIADHKARILLRGYYIPFAKLKRILDKAVARAPKRKAKKGSVSAH
jgi:thiol-disulfide isomerase/thioredoxin